MEEGMQGDADDTGDADALMDDVELDDAHIDAALQDLQLPHDLGHHEMASDLLMQQMAALSSGNGSLLDMQHLDRPLPQDLLQQLDGGVVMKKRWGCV